MLKFFVGYFGLYSVLLTEDNLLRHLEVTLLVITVEPSVFRVAGAPGRLSTPLHAYNRASVISLYYPTNAQRKTRRVN